MFGDGGVRRDNDDDEDDDDDGPPPPPVGNEIVVVVVVVVDEEGRGCSEGINGSEDEDAEDDVADDVAIVGDRSGYLVAEQDRDGPVRRVFWCLALPPFAVFSFATMLLVLLLLLLLGVLYCC